jgi:hypothetical protein
MPPFSLRPGHVSIAEEGAQQAAPSLSLSPLSPAHPRLQGRHRVYRRCQRADTLPPRFAPTYTAAMSLRIGAVIVSILAVALTGCGAPADGTVNGTLVFYGGPAVLSGDPGYHPTRGTVTVFATRGRIVVKKHSTDDTGKFSVTLAPGTYIFASAPLSDTSCKTATVAVTSSSEHTIMIGCPVP